MLANILNPIPMKNLLLIIFLLSACTSISNAQNTANQQREFEEIAQTFQKKYMGGNENCDDILKSLDDNIQMSEITFLAPVKSFSYEQIVQFCPHLPKKQVIETTTEQKLLTAELGYDYVNQLYLRKSVGDTVRETSSRIWANKNGGWKIIQMNNSLNKACD